MNLFKLSLTLSKSCPFFGPFLSFWSPDFNLLSGYGALWKPVSGFWRERMFCYVKVTVSYSSLRKHADLCVKYLGLWDTRGCHWLAMTFSLMVMTFCLSQCACSCRWLWESVELSDSKVESKKKETFHHILFVISDNYRSFNIHNTHRLLSIQPSAALVQEIYQGIIAAIINLRSEFSPIGWTQLYFF